MLDGVIPNPRLQETDSVDVAAPAARVWQRLRHADLAQSPLIRALFALRTLPARLHGEASPSAIRIDDFRSTPERPGFTILAEDEGREVVVGAIGKVWQADIPFEHVTKPEEFSSFDRKEFVKVAWALRALPLDEASTRVEIEVRVTATDERSWRRFRRYFRVIGPGSRYIRHSLLRSLEQEFDTRPRDGVRDVVEGIAGAARIAASALSPFRRRARSHWGLDEATASRQLPGDELVPEPLWSYTHGIEIDAPAERVWPWVAQLGANRAGFYSYQWLENIAGCALHNANTLHPEWAVKLGDGVSLHPEMPPMRVVEYAAGRHFVALAAPDERARAAGRPWSMGSWLFLVEPLGEARSRLFSRFRGDCSRDLGTRLAFGPTLIEPVSFAMDRRMLLGIKERAQRALR